VQTRGFGQLKKDKDGNVIPDGHLIDDWAGDELVQFAASLSRLINFKFCIVNYVFLSRIYTAIQKSIYKILVTHDVFSNRNSRIFDTYGGQEGFYFSVEPDEEKKGLNRANLVLAIQEEDKRFFKDELDIGNVMTLPYIPAKKTLPHRPPGKPLKVGYLGSGHHPNIEAMLQFIDHLNRFDGFVLLVAGSICGSLPDISMPDNVKLVGYISNVEDFYSKCDVVINPDMLRSGLKIKSIEALSFGKPLVCTEAASVGLFAESRYHTAKSIEECANIILELVRHPEKISEVADLSNKLFEQFYNYYHDKNRIEAYEAMAREHAEKL
jgi:glycosyltransferase involved in cell wall biosynthesis